MGLSLYKWLWQGKQKPLLLFFVASVILWGIAYFLVHYTICETNNRQCLDLWLHSIGKPFVGGHLLKAMIVAPILLLPFSSRVFAVWAVMSAVILPIAFYRVIFVVSLYSKGVGDFTKLAENNVFGIIYIALTIAIIVLVSGFEWIRKSRKA